MGIDTDFWAEGGSDGKWVGTPSVMTGENCHQIKWPLDLFIIWPWIYDQIPDACLHAIYLPNDMHRWFFPLVNRNGASYGAHITPLAFHGPALRNVFKSTDYQVGLVRYGDFNRMSLEANAAKGCKTVSYRGNPYTDFWVTEGDQRKIAEELTEIIRGEVKPRVKSPVPNHLEMANTMKGLYETLMVKDQVVIPSNGFSDNILDLEVLDVTT
jgi:hypothetical protein